MSKTPATAGVLLANVESRVKTVEGGTEDLYVERVMERQRVDMGKETIPMPEECERKLTERR